MRGRVLKAPRYAENAPEWLKTFLVERLPFLDFHEAHDFYDDALRTFTGPELALLGCNDRYFLLTSLLNRPDAIHPWLYARAREVEADPDGYLDLWARMHFKSTVITFAGCVQEIVIDPEIRIGIFANTKDISTPFVSQIKDEFEKNEELKDLYPDVLWRNPKKEAPLWSAVKGLIVKRKGNPKEATVEPHGVIRAMPTGRHFPLLVFDDAITEKNVTNEDQIALATERIELADNLGVHEGTRKWFVGTRYSYADTYGQMIDSGSVKVRLHPATENGKLDGKPVLLSQEVWDEKKRAQRSTISAQMLQNPIAGNENTFRMKWLLGYWVRPTIMNVYILCDPSKGRNKSSDRTAIVVIGIDTTGNKYLLDGVCHRMPLSERWNWLQRLYRKWSQTPGVQICRVGYERYGMQSDDEYFEEKMRNDPKAVRFEITILNWVGEHGQESKKSRVERLEPDFREGSFFIPAKVWHNAEDFRKYEHTARWYLKDGSDELFFKAYGAKDRDEHRAINAGESWRLFDPLRRLDEDNKMYDLTRVFVEEFRFWPFSPRKDLIDAMSRIYDMDPTTPVLHEKVEEPEYPD